MQTPRSGFSSLELCQVKWSTSHHCLVPPLIVWESWQGSAGGELFFLGGNFSPYCMPWIAGWMVGMTEEMQRKEGFQPFGVQPRKGLFHYSLTGLLNPILNTPVCTDCVHCSKFYSKREELKFLFLIEKRWMYEKGDWGRKGWGNLTCSVCQACLWEVSLL